MTLALVGSATSTTASATVIYTLVAAIPVGSLVVVSENSAIGSRLFSSVTDSRSNTYVAAVKDEVRATSTAIASSVITTALQIGDTITVTLSGNSTSKSMVVYTSPEHATTPADASGGTNGSTDGASVTVSTSGATTQTRETNIGVCCHAGGTAAWAQPGSWVEDLDTTVSSRQHSGAHLALTAVGTQTYNPVNGSTTAAWSACVATFRETGLRLVGHRMRLAA